MSRGGKHTNKSGVRAVASVLGIDRQDMCNYMHLNKDPPPLYPKMTRQVLPPSESPEVAAMVDIKEHLLNRFQLSQFYQEQRGSKEITRYTDKYRFERQSEPFETDFSRLPAELDWKRQIGAKRSAKICKLNDTNIEERILKLEENAEKIDNELEVIKKEEGDDAESSETEQKRPNLNEEDDELSDDDYLEEDNDYVANYFDNGEGLGDSDDNLDEGNVF